MNHLMLKLPRTAALLAVCTVLAAAAAAQTKQPGASKTPSAPPPKPDAARVPPNVRALNEDEIQLSPGDVIQIQVENHPTLDGSYQVPGTGKLLLPEAGTVPVAGLTIKQFGEMLQTDLEKTLNNVFVRVLLKEVHSRHASISGFVQHPGNIDMGTNQYRLLDIIDYAGGLAPPTRRLDATKSEYICTLYRDAVKVGLDLETAYTAPEGAANIVIKPQDRIDIDLKPLVTHEIHILGEIPRPGAYALDNNTTVLTLFGQAGYPSTSSSLSTAYVLRGTAKIPLDLRPLLTGNADLAVNHFKFADGDILYIPAVKTTYMVWGQVARQGNFPYPEAATIKLLDALNESGRSPEGNYHEVHLLRTVDGKQHDQKIDVDAMVRKGLLKDNVLLQPNDIVFVPPRKHAWKPSIQDVFTPLMLMNFLGIRPFL